MAIDLQTEEVLSLTDAAKALPPVDGRRPHVSTIWRWCRRGVRGVHLEHARIGHRVVTSQQALSRFAQRLAETDADPPAQPVRQAGIRPRTERQRQRDVARAKRALDRAGI